MDENIRKQFGIDEQKPTDWFETLYAKTNQKGEGVPWANMAPHPLFKNWISKHPNLGHGKTALVVGCGLGDDAIALESQGFNVTAFDVSESAIALCKKRFPNTHVKFVQADLIQGVAGWHRKFDFVLEIFTIQALPPKYETLVIKNISDFVAKNGTLMVITEVRKGKRTFENGPPWLLNHMSLKAFEDHGLKQLSHSTHQNAEIGEEIQLTLFQKK